jgi:hypothetical protein
MSQGIAALWKGAVPTASGMILENCMAFGVNEALKRAFPDDPATKVEGGPPNLSKPFVMVRIGCRLG